MTIIHLPTVDSTNLYCERLDLSQVEAFTVYWADRQTAGIGQRGNSWHATPGESLTFSLVLKPSFLRADRQFVLTQVLSLALCDLLDGLGLPPEAVHIKWPNDIYLSTPRSALHSEPRTPNSALQTPHSELSKVCGMLITNRLQGPHIAASVCGIGLNVNQASFPPELPHATSLRMAAGRHFELEPLLNTLLRHVGVRYASAERGDDLTEDYHARLLGLGVEADYIHLGRPLRATIVGTDPLGHLLLRTVSGTPLTCSLKEISPVL